MKITLLASGTRGDVQPFVALALALQRRGHDVRVAAAQGFADMVAQSGARHVPLSADYEEIFQSEEGVRWLSAGNTFKLMQMLADMDRRIRPRMNRELLAASEGADAIIGNLVIENAAACIAEKLGVPLILGYTMPVLPNSDFPSPFFAKRMFNGRKMAGRTMNRLTHSLLETVYWQTQKKIVNGWRAELGLPPTSISMRVRLWRAGVPILHCYSTHIVPRPSDWGDANVMTGYWTMPEDMRMRACGDPSPELVRWLEAGSPPVYLGYWRLPVTDKAAMLRLAVDVANTLGIRFVIGANWTEQEIAALRVPENIFITSSVDHDWLFERCSATVHHGGAGTTAATLRAGLPMVIFPLCNDQPFWGRRITDLGVGTCMPFEQLTATRLGQALRGIQSEDVRTRARKLGEALRREDGIATAVRTIEERLPAAPILSRPAPAVSKTAFWIANFRAMETERPDALFRDPLASRLVGRESRRAARFLKYLGLGSPFWSVVIRTHIIDLFVREKVGQQRVDTVLNLGAGLDTRPYRLDLPPTLRWIEVDFSNIVDLKEERLRGEIPRCRLERVKLDISDRGARTRLFDDVAAASSKVLVLTEGVTPYFTSEQVALLAADLRARPSFRYWINDYLAPAAGSYVRRGSVLRLLKKTPIQFVPDDWFGFFHQHGWKAQDTRYLGEESKRVGRPSPVSLQDPLSSSAYVLLVPSDEERVAP
ncbi:SAM-dependent methyltransferase [Pendulispora brunnea]|uniref:SAM-dependent methyltransferase n=1 Tax=Pendulispora brunnea TaxID=2905690 RepID=A0ABZ2JYN5_9BACT